MTAPLQYGAPPPSDPTAVIGRRVLAWLADLALFSAVVLAGFASMSEYTEIPAGVAEADACDLFEQQHPDAADTCIAYDGDIYLLDTGEAGVQTLLSFGWFAFFVLLQGLTGGSPGKLLFGLRVVDEHGNRCGIGRSLGRTLLWIVDAAPWIIPLVGPITAFTSTGHRRVGDLAAGTFVVASSSVGAPVGAGAGAPGSQAQWGAPPPVPGQGWGPPTAPPTASWPGTPPPATPAPPTVAASTPPDAPPPEPELDFRRLDVPEPTERADEAPPTVEPDADWSTPPDVATAEPPAPEWSAPTLPEITEPATEWRPPSEPEPEPEPEPAPFAAPGAESTSAPPAAAPQGPAQAPSPQEWPPPQWDQARGTYLQWDPNRQAWLQWDATRQHWKPIDT